MASSAPGSGRGRKFSKERSKVGFPCMSPKFHVPRASRDAPAYGIYTIYVIHTRCHAESELSTAGIFSTFRIDFPNVLRAHSSGKPSPFNEDAVNSKLFEKAKAAPFPPEEAAEAGERIAAEPSTAGQLEPLLWV